MSALTVIARVLLVLATVTGLSAAWIYAPASPARLQAADSASFQVSVEPKPLELVCPGAAIRVGGDSGTNADLIERLGEAGLQLQTAAGESAPDFAASFSEFQSFSLSSAEAQSSNLMSAWQFQQLDAARIGGIAAAACQSPRTQHWLIGGSTQSQSETMLAVYNASSVEAAITVTVYGGNLPVNLDFALPPGGSQLTSLATLLNRTEAIAVSIDSTAPTAAWLQQRTNRGLASTGFDWVSSVPKPETQLVFAGLRVQGSEQVPIPELATAVLRVFNPQPEPAEVFVSVVSSEGQFGLAERIVVNPGTLSQLSLSGLRDGQYTVAVSAELEVLAGVFSPIVVDGSFDFAWLAASERFVEPFALAASETDYQLALANPNDTSVSLVIERNRMRTAISLRPNSLAVVPIAADTEVRISPSAAVSATMQFDVGGYTVVQPVETRNLGTNLEISVR